MKNCDSNKVDIKIKKVFSYLAKCFVLMFAFVFGGLVGGNQKVEAIMLPPSIIEFPGEKADIVIEKNNTFYILGSAWSTWSQTTSVEVVLKTSDGTRVGLFAYDNHENEIFDEKTYLYCFYRGGDLLVKNCKHSVDLRETSLNQNTTQVFARMSFGIESNGYSLDKKIDDTLRIHMFEMNYNMDEILRNHSGMKSLNYTIILTVDTDNLVGDGIFGSTEGFVYIDSSPISLVSDSNNGVSIAQTSTQSLDVYIEDDLTSLCSYEVIYNGNFYSSYIYGEISNNNVSATMSFSSNIRYKVALTLKNLKAGKNSVTVIFRDLGRNEAYFYWTIYYDSAAPIVENVEVSDTTTTGKVNYKIDVTNDSGYFRKLIITYKVQGGSSSSDVTVTLGNIGSSYQGVFNINSTATTDTTYELEFVVYDYWNRKSNIKKATTVYKPGSPVVTITHGNFNVGEVANGSTIYSKGVSNEMNFTIAHDNIRELSNASSTKPGFSIVEGAAYLDGIYTGPIITINATTVSTSKNTTTSYLGVYTSVPTSTEGKVYTVNITNIYITNSSGAHTKCNDYTFTVIVDTVAPTMSYNFGKMYYNEQNFFSCKEKNDECFVGNLDNEAIGVNGFYIADLYPNFEMEGLQQYHMIDGDVVLTDIFTTQVEFRILNNNTTLLDHSFKYTNFRITGTSDEGRIIGSVSKAKKYCSEAGGSFSESQSQMFCFYDEFIFDLKFKFDIKELDNDIGEITLDDELYLYIKNFSDKAGNSYCSSDEEVDGYCKLNRIYYTNEKSKLNIEYGTTSEELSHNEIYFLPSTTDGEITFESTDAYLSSTYTIEAYNFYGPKNFNTNTLGNLCNDKYCLITSGEITRSKTITIPKTTAYHYIFKITVHSNDISSQTFVVSLDHMEPHKNQNTIKTSESIEVQIDENTYKDYIKLPDLTEYISTAYDVSFDEFETFASNRGEGTTSWLNRNYWDKLSNYEIYVVLDEDIPISDSTHYVLSNDFLLSDSSYTKLTYKIKVIDYSGNFATVTVMFDNTPLNVSEKMKGEHINKYEDNHYFNLDSNLTSGQQVSFEITNNATSDTQKINIVSYSYTIGKDPKQTITNNSTYSSILPNQTINYNFKITGLDGSEVDILFEITYSNDFGMIHTSTIYIHVFANNQKVSNIGSYITKDDISLSFNNASIANSDKTITSDNSKIYFFVGCNDSNINTLTGAALTATINDKFKYYGGEAYNITATISNPTYVQEQRIKTFDLTFSNVLLKNDSFNIQVVVVFIDASGFTSTHNGGSYNIANSFNNNQAVKATINFQISSTSTPGLPNLNYAYCSSGIYCPSSDSISISNKTPTINSSNLQISYVEPDLQVEKKEIDTNIDDKYYTVTYYIKVSNLANGDMNEVPVKFDIYLYDDPVTLTPIYYPVNYSGTDIISLNTTEIDDVTNYYYSSSAHYNANYYYAFKVNVPGSKKVANVTWSNITAGGHQTYLTEAQIVENKNILLLYVTTTDEGLETFKYPNLSFTLESGMQYSYNAGTFKYIVKDIPTIEIDRTNTEYIYTDKNNEVEVRIKSSDILYYDSEEIAGSIFKLENNEGSAVYTSSSINRLSGKSTDDKYQYSIKFNVDLNNNNYLELTKLTLRYDLNDIAYNKLTADSYAISTNASESTIKIIYIEATNAKVQNTTTVNNKVYISNEGQLLIEFKDYNEGDWELLQDEALSTKINIIFYEDDKFCVGYDNSLPDTSFTSKGLIVNFAINCDDSDSDNSGLGESKLEKITSISFTLSDVIFKEVYIETLSGSFDKEYIINYGLEDDAFTVSPAVGTDVYINKNGSTTITITNNTNQTGIDIEGSVINGLDNICDNISKVAIDNGIKFTISGCEVASASVSPVTVTIKTKTGDTKTLNTIDLYVDNSTLSADGVKVEYSTDGTTYQTYSSASKAYYLVGTGSSASIYYRVSFKNSSKTLTNICQYDNLNDYISVTNYSAALIKPSDFCTYTEIGEGDTKTKAIVIKYNINDNYKSDSTPTISVTIQDQYANKITLTEFNNLDIKYVGNLDNVLTYELLHVSEKCELIDNKYKCDISDLPQVTGENSAYKIQIKVYSTEFNSIKLSADSIVLKGTKEAEGHTSTSCTLSTTGEFYTCDIKVDASKVTLPYDKYQFKLNKVQSVNDTDLTSKYHLTVDEASIADEFYIFDKTKLENYLLEDKDKPYSYTCVFADSNCGTSMKNDFLGDKLEELTTYGFSVDVSVPNIEKPVEEKTTATLTLTHELYSSNALQITIELTYRKRSITITDITDLTSTYKAEQIISDDNIKYTGDGLIVGYKYTVTEEDESVDKEINDTISGILSFSLCYGTGDNEECKSLNSADAKAFGKGNYTLKVILTSTDYYELSDSSVTTYDYKIVEKEIKLVLADFNSAELYTFNDNSCDDETNVTSVVNTLNGNKAVSQQYCFKGIEKDGAEIELTGVTLQFADTSKAGSGLQLNVTGYNLEYANYVIDADSYKPILYLGAIGEKGITLNLTDVLIKYQDGGTDVYYKNNMTSYKVTTTNDVIVTLPQSLENLKYQEDKVGTVNIVAKKGYTLAGIFDINNDNYTITSVTGTILEDNFTPSFTLTSDAMSETDGTYYTTNSSLTLNVIISDTHSTYYHYSGNNVYYKSSTDSEDSLGSEEIILSTNGSYTIKVCNGYNNKCSEKTITVNIDNTEFVLSSLVVKKDNGVISTTQYVNKTSVSSVSLTFTFSRPVNKTSVLVINTTLGKITTDSTNVDGSTIKVTLSSFDLSEEGALIINSLSGTIKDTYGNLATNLTSYITEDNKDTNIIYDKTAPVIESITVDDATIATGGSATYTIEITEANYTCSSPDCQQVTGGYNVTKTVTYNNDESGIQSFTYSITDLAGNSASKTVRLVNVGSNKPVVDIVSATYINDNKIYYDGTHTNKITISVSDEDSKICTLTKTNNVFKCGEYITVDDGKITINKDISEINEFGEKNDAYLTDYVIVDYSSSEFTPAILNDESNAILSGSDAIISANVVNTYTITFTSTRDIASVSKGEIYLTETANTYTFKFDQKIEVGEVSIYDYLGNVATLVNIVSDTTGPTIDVNDQVLTLDVATSGKLFSFDVTGAKTKVGGTITPSDKVTVTSSTTTKLELTFKTPTAGTYTITIPAGYYTDLVGNKSAKTTFTVLVDNVPVISLSSLDYNETELTAIYSVSDSGDYNKDTRYCISTIEGANSDCRDISVVNNKITINFEFTALITYKDFKITIDPITDVNGNISNSVETTSLSLVHSLENPVYLTSAANCGTDTNCMSSYELALGYTVTNYKNVTKGLGVEIITKGVRLSSDINQNGVSFTVTVKDTANPIKATYTLNLDNFIVNVDKATADQITITLNEGLYLATYKIDNENILGSGTINTPQTSDKVCTLNEECEIVINVTDRSNWKYSITKVLPLTEIENPVINGISSDTIVVNGITYIVRYRDTEAALQFVHSSDKVMPLSEQVSEYVAGAYTITYGYYGDSSVLTSKDYYIYVVDPLKLTEEISDKDSYKNVHTLDLGEMFNDVFDIDYEITLSNDNNIYTLTENKLSDVMRIKDNILTMHSLDGIYDLSVKVNIEGQSQVYETIYEDIKFDNAIYDEEVSYSVDNSAWAQNRVITITFTCTREDDTCKYYDSSLASEEEYTYVVTENGAYTYSFSDDAGNTKEIVVNVERIDTTAPVIDDKELKNSVLIGETLYTSKPYVSIDAHDYESGIVSYLFGYKLTDDTDDIEWNVPGSMSPTISFDLNVEAIKEIWVAISDLAGNVKEEKLFENINIASLSAKFTSIELNSSKTVNHINYPNVKVTIGEEQIEIKERYICITNVDEATTCFGQTDIDFTNNTSYKHGDEISFYFKAVDALGNEHTSDIYQQVKIDIEAPTKEDVTINAYYNGETYFVKDSNGMISIVVSEEAEVIINNPSCKESPCLDSIKFNATTGNTNALGDTDVALGLVTVTIVDLAGNSATYSYNIVKDTDVPVISGLPIAIEYMSNVNTSFNNDGNIIVYLNKAGVKVNLAAVSDSGSGLYKVCLLSSDIDFAKQACKNALSTYYTPSGIPSDISSAYYLDSGTFYFYLIDNIGNEKTIEYEFVDISSTIIGFEITKDKITPTMGSIVLTVNPTKEVSDSEVVSITWNDGTTCSSINNCSKAITENGTYSVTVVNKYGLVNTQSITVNNIDNSEVVKDEEKVEVVVNTKDGYSNVINKETNYYFVNNSIFNSLEFNLPEIVSNGEYVKLNVTFANSKFESTIYKANYKNNKYIIDLSTVGDLIHNDTYTVKFEIVATNGANYSQEITLIYVDASNIVVTADNLLTIKDSDGNDVEFNRYNEVTISLDSSEIYTGVAGEIVSYTLSNSYGKLLDKNTSSVVLASEGTYKKFSLTVIDSFGNSYINNDIEYTQFVIDLTSDEIVIGNIPDKLNQIDNKVYVSYTAIRSVDDNDNVVDKILINHDSINFGYTLKIYGYDSNEDGYTKEILLDENNQFVYEQFIIVVEDYAGNVTSLENPIVVTVFEESPSATYSVVISQNSDGNKPTFELKIDKVNVDNYSYEGYKVCNDAECNSFVSDTINTSTSLDSVLGKYIKIFAKDTHNVLNSTPIDIRLDAILDLSNYSLDVVPTFTTDLTYTSVIVKDSLEFKVSNTNNYLVDNGISVNTYILVQSLSVATGYNTINDSEGFMKAYKGYYKDIVKKYLNSEYTGVISGLSYGEYIIYILNHTRYKENDIYSTIKTISVKVDNLAPIATSSGNELANDWTYNNTLYVNFKDERTGSIVYSINGSDYDTANSVQINNGITKLEICDIDHSKNPLNCQSYTVTVDSEAPKFELRTSSGSSLTAGSDVTHGYKVLNNKYNLLETRLLVTDMSLKDVTFTFNSSGGFLYTYQFSDGIFYKDATNLSLKLIKDSTHYGVELFDVDGNLMFNKLWAINDSEFANGATVEIDGITFRVSGESLVPVSGILIEEGAIFPLRILLSILFSNCEDFTSIEEVTRLTIEATDKSPANRSRSVVYNFDLARPVISVISAIENSSYVGYLSNKAYKYLTTKNGNTLVSCNGNAASSLKQCSYNHEGLYLQVVKDNQVSSSERIRNLLKYIILIDGKGINSYDSSRLHIYTNREFTGSYVDSYVDTGEEKILSQLIKVGTYDLVIKYTDEVGNESVYYIPLIVEDTIAPVVSGKVKDSATITDNSSGVSIDLSSISATDNYSDNLTCSFTVTYNSSKHSEEFICSSSQDVIIDGISHASYDADNKLMTFIYRGKYTITYKYSDKDKDGNVTVVSYDIEVKDGTKIEYLITGDSNKIDVNENKIIVKNPYNIDLVRVEGIDLVSLATISLYEVNELGIEYTMESATLISATLNNVGIEVDGLNNIHKSKQPVIVNSIGTYLVTYEITNFTKIATKIIYQFEVVDITKPTIELDYTNSKDYYAGDNTYIIDKSKDSSVGDLANLVLTGISASYSDNYYAFETLVTAFACVGSDQPDSTNKYIISYSCKYQVTDASSNTNELSITIIVRDLINPLVSGANNTVSVNTGNVEVTLPECSDNDECIVYYSVNKEEEKVYTKPFTLEDLSEGLHTVEYYAKDRVGNKSTVYTYSYNVDLTNPQFDIVINFTGNQIEDYGSCGIFGNENCSINNEDYYYVLSDNQIIEIFNRSQDNIIVYTHHGTQYDTGSSVLTEISETGLYKIESRDAANNQTTKEIYVYKQVKDELGNKKIEILSVTGDTSENVTLNYRSLYIVEYNSKNQSIKYNEEVFGSITKTDGVYLIGVNGANQYVKLIKYNGQDLYNTITEIKANADGVSDSLIEIEGNSYLLMALVDNDNGVADEGTQEGTTPEEQQGDNGNSKSYTWIFYILGVIGILGGGFLIIKLRNKVKAA